MTTSTAQHYDAQRLVDLHAVAVACAKVAARETTGETIQSVLSAHDALDRACENFRRNYYPRAGRVFASSFGEVFTVSPKGRKVTLVFPEARAR